MKINPTYLTGSGSPGGGESNSGSSTFGDSGSAAYIQAFYFVLDKRYTRAGEIESITLLMNDKCSDTAQVQNAILAIYEETEPDSDTYQAIGYSTNEVTPTAGTNATWKFEGVTLKGDRNIKLHYTDASHGEFTWPSSYREFNPEDAQYRPMMLSASDRAGDDFESYIFGQNSVSYNLWPFPGQLSQTYMSFANKNLVPVGTIKYKEASSSTAPSIITFGSESEASWVDAHWFVLDKKYTAAAEIESISLTMSQYCIGTKQLADVVLGIYEEVNPGADQFEQLGFSTNAVTLATNAKATWEFSGVKLKGDRAIKLYYSDNSHTEWKPWSASSTDFAKNNNPVMSLNASTTTDGDTVSYVWGANNVLTNEWPPSGSSLSMYTKGMEKKTVLPVGQIKFKTD